MAAGDTCMPEANALQTKNTDESRSIGLCTEIETQLNPAAQKTRTNGRKSEPANSKSKNGDSKSRKLLGKRANKICLRKVRSRELCSGVVYIDCDCYRRNGLQHDCPRTSCGGPSCRVRPWPKCDMAEYFMEKWDAYYEHLDTIPPTSFCGSKEEWLASLEKERKKIERIL